MTAGDFSAGGGAGPGSKNHNWLLVSGSSRGVATPAHSCVDMIRRDDGRRATLRN